MTPIIAATCFDEVKQSAFALLSGDTNPLHMDPVFARRTQLGAPVVHGIHLLAWALEAFGPRPVQGITVRFVKPVLVGERVTLHQTAATETQIRLAIMADGVPVVQVALALQTAPPEARLAAAVTAEPAALSEPRALDLAAMAGRVGAVSLAQRSAVAEAFPRLAAAWGQDRLAALIATSRLVGMECPGLQSLYSELRLAVAEGRGGGKSLRYAVTQVDERFRTVDMEVVGPGLDGTVSALARPAPVEQPGLAELRFAMPNAVLADRPHRALIIGGSRGLGALTARLVAAGGGQPIITYAVGRGEAEAVAAELGCEILPYDVRLPAAEQLAGLKQHPTHLYYFATGHIFRRPAASFSSEYFDEYVRFYVTGFSALLDALRDRGVTNLTVFYPSTTALDDPVKELAEYAAAKAAGEQLCRQINAFSCDVYIEIRRLPRLLTDQTATSSVVAFGDGVGLLASAIQAMHARGWK